MPAKTLFVHPSVKKNLKKFPMHIHKKVIASLDKIQENPLIGAKLSGELTSYFKYRIGDYRIVYRLDSKNNVIEVAKIEHRQGVYK